MRIRFWVLIVLIVFVALPTPGTGQFPSDGSPSGRSKSGDRDPSRLFDMMSGGKDVIIRDTLTSSFQQGMFDRFAQGMGVTDGRITRAQFTAYMQQKAASGTTGSTKSPSTGGGPNGSPSFGSKGDRSSPQGGGDPSEMFDRWAEGMFRRLDTNGDGLLNYDEMTESLRAERDKWDTNHDGFIDLTEFKAYFRAAMQQRMAERGAMMDGTDGSLPLPVPDVPIEEEQPKQTVWRAGKLPKDLPSWFKTIDTDGDGQISLYEWRSSGRPIDEFQRMDRNGDGFLTIAEVLYFNNGKNNLNGVAIVSTVDKDKDKQVEVSPGGSAPDSKGIETKGTESPSTQTKSSSSGKGNRGPSGGSKYGRPN